MALIKHMSVCGMDEKKKNKLRSGVFKLIRFRSFRKRSLERTEVKHRYRSCVFRFTRMEKKIYHNGADNASSGKKVSKKPASDATPTSESISAKIDAPKKVKQKALESSALAKKKKKKERQQNARKFELMANELENEKSRSDELRKELEKVRMEKQQLESTAAATAAASVDVENQSVSDYSENFRPHSTQRERSTLEESRFMSSINQLSISSVNVPECKPVGEETEIQRHAYEQWKNLLVDAKE